MARLRRLVIRARACGDHDRADACALLLAWAEAGIDVPDLVIDMVAWREAPR